MKTKNKQIETMKQEQTNKLIAEFMGMQHTNVGWYDSEEVISLNYTNDNTFDNLLFDSSWDWLMPVVEKCTQVGYRDSQDFEDERYLKWEELFGDRESMFLGNHIGEVHATVVEFIKWYNEQK